MRSCLLVLALLLAQGSACLSEPAVADMVTEQGQAVRLRMPLAAFIEQVFGADPERVLQIEPQIRLRSDEVELRLVAAPDRERLQRIARWILTERGVRLREEGPLLLAEAVDPGSGQALPRPVTASGIAAQAPDSQVMIYRTLTAASIERTSGWLAEEFALRGVETSEDPGGNALLLAGPAAAVEEALRFVDVLDRPLLRGSHSRLLALVHTEAEALAETLSQVLQSEGIEARTNAVGSAVTLVALTESRGLVVFATRPDLLEHTTAWVQLLDAEAGYQSEGVFSHALSHITATRAVEVLSALVSPDTPLVADPTRNAVVFRGPPAQWRLLLAQLPAMDLPSATVMVEVLVLELSLESRFESGLDWLVSRRIDAEELSVGTSGLSSGEAGFNLLLRDGNTVRAALALFAGDARVAIRSRPRLVVASGHEARLEVGNEIPVVASTARSTTRPDSPLVSNVEYRRTGLVLAIRPTVHAGDRVDIEVMQDLSNARETASSDIDSPTILSRRLQTSVSLRDGGAVLLGGLLASSGTTGTAGGMPLPAPANALDARLRERARTELLVFIRPQVLRSPEEASAASALP